MSSHDRRRVRATHHGLGLSIVAAIASALAPVITNQRFSACSRS